MRVLVLGATGGTGRLVVREALAAGHEVVALVRSPARAGSLDGAAMVEGDARDGAALARALEGCEGVVSALGTGLSSLLMLSSGTARSVESLCGTRKGCPPTWRSTFLTPVTCWRV